MFDAATYNQRRASLKAELDAGLILMPGNNEAPMNYPANPYPFRQDSTFLYYWGLDEPGLAAVMDLEEERDILYGDDVSIEDVIWTGPLPSLKEKIGRVGVREWAPLRELKPCLDRAMKKGRKIHFLPPYRAAGSQLLSELLGLAPEQVGRNVSEPLIRAVVTQRSVKSPEEVEQIEMALEVSHAMHTTAMRLTGPGKSEYDVTSILEGLARSKNRAPAFPIIFSVHGEILHGLGYGNVMESGQMVVHDSGAESPLHYASDITRTLPVSGRFSPEQKVIYEIVLKAQIEAIGAIRPGVRYRDVHLLAASVIVEGLKGIGLMKGDTKAAVREGAQALFFPHGIGHMLGLDGHDMEGLGEDYVGYDGTVRRSDQFGLAYLRLAREVQPGFVVTVEPGVYFIPALLDLWQGKRKCRDFIDYGAVSRFRHLGGVRIEDDVLVTESGHRVLGRPIPKTVEAVEDHCT